MKLITMIHMKSLLGSGSFEDNLEDIESHIIRSLDHLQQAGVDEVMFENNDDEPSQEFVSLPQAVHFAYLIGRIKDKIKIPFGFTVLLNDRKTGIALCKVSGGTTLRLDTFVDEVKRVSDGIVIKPNPKEIIQYKKDLGAEHVKLYTDVQVKHTVMVDTNKTLEDSIETAIEHGSDGIIVTGSRTGKETDLRDIQRAKKAINGRVPLIVGSGINADNISIYKQYADIAIVGTSIKEDGEISFEKAKVLVDLIR